MYREERPYQCDICHMLLTSASHLKIHKRTHTEEKPYECDICHKSFETISNLNEHKMIHTGERSYECDTCQMTFKYPSNLKRHKMTHTGEKSHECDDCHKSFRFASHLETHKRVHRGRSYICDISQQTYSESSILTKRTEGTLVKPCEYNVSSQSSQTNNIHLEHIDSIKPYDREFPYKSSPKKHNAYNKSKDDFIDTCMIVDVLDKYDNGDTVETCLYSHQIQHMNKNDNEQDKVLVNDLEIAVNEETDILYNCVQPERTSVNEIALDVEQHTYQIESQYMESDFLHEPLQQPGLVKRNCACDLCVETFTTIDELQSHKLTHIYFDL